jgi:transcriptional regulator with GAF, ATPase, and Fis domain
MIHSGNPPISFFEQLVQYQRTLSAELESDRIPESILEIVRNCMDAENVLLVGVEGGLAGNWWVRNEGSKVSSSMDVIRKALANEEGYWRGGTAVDFARASESQKKENILSCLAAKICAGSRTIGVIYCDVRHGSRRFTDEDGERLKLLADLFAVYVDYFQSTHETKQKAEKTLRKVYNDPLLLGETTVMKNLKSDLETAARLSTSVLLFGESGVGKEVAAQYVHKMSDRSHQPFAAIHCAAIPRDLLESELFGHEKGAFSGAYRKHRGRMELANHGTLFLDEVGDISLEFQVKLLRVIEDKKIWPVGSEAEIGPLDFRLICSTNRPIKKMVSEQTFREDLFYRISGMQIRIPPMRERLEDIPLLASYFASQGGNPKKVEDAAIQLLELLDWPGNVRQLRTILENARDLATGPIITKEAIQKQLGYQSLTESKNEQSPGRITFEEIQRRWNSGDMDGKELQNIIVPLYLESRKNLSAVARKLQCSTPQQLREFRNFIYYRRKTGTIDLPS